VNRARTCEVRALSAPHRIECAAGGYGLLAIAEISIAKKILGNGTGVIKN
jgi:hypothetical protein